MQPALQLICGLADSVVSGDRDLYEARKILTADIAKDSTGYPEALAIILENVSTPRIGYVLADLGLTAAKTLDLSGFKYDFSHQLAFLALSSGRYEKAIDLLRDNIDFLEKTSRSNPARKMLLVREYISLANVFNTLGSSKDALQHCLKGIEHDDTLSPQLRNSVPEYRFILADANNTVGCVYKDAGKIEESLGYFIRSAAECAAMAKQSSDPVLRELMSAIANNLGLVCEKLAEQIEEGTAFLQSPNISSLLLELDLPGHAHEQIVTSLRSEALASFERATAISTAASFRISRATSNLLILRRPLRTSCWPRKKLQEPACQKFPFTRR
jgi:tetratricopeptide (TPR) repeat protein